jgi:hypothetical protein
MAPTKKEAIRYIIESGWQPEKHTQIDEAYFWDGVDPSVGYAWLAAYEEIKRREKARMQPGLFGGAG